MALLVEGEKASALADSKAVDTPPIKMPPWFNINKDNHY